MLNLPNFYQWLAQQGKLHLLETASEAEIKVWRIEYRKFYKQEYNKFYRKEKIHRLIIFNPDEFELLKKEAEKYGQSFSGFVKNSALAYLNQEFILPSPEQTREVLIAFTRYGTNLNQIAHISNSNKSIFSNQVSHIQNNFNELNKKITRIYTQPFKLEQVLSQTLKTNPTYIEQIKPIVTPYL